MFEESLHDIFKRVLIEYNFQYPMTWTWIGINGRAVTGRFERKKDGGLKTIMLNGKPKTLRFPVNAMLVDATGQAVHILFKSSMQLGEMNRCKVDEPPPAVPPFWPGGIGKA